MQKAFNKNGSVTNLGENSNINNSRTMPVSPSRDVMQQNYMKSDVQEFIKSHQ